MRVKNLKINDRIQCKVTGVQPYGVFVTCENDYQGLIHISEISDKYVAAVDKLFTLGDLIYVSVLEIDENEKKLKLSYKKAHLVHPKVFKKLDIKIGFRSLENKLKDWISEKKEEMEHGTKDFN
jgi:general stress protein 13